MNKPTDSKWKVISEAAYRLALQEKFGARKKLELTSSQAYEKARLKPNKKACILENNDMYLKQSFEPEPPFVYDSLPFSHAGPDMFGSVRFDGAPSPIAEPVGAPRPTSLPVTGALDLSKEITQRVADLSVDPVPDTSSPEALMLPNDSEMNSKPRKDHRMHSLSEKCKYLIEERQQKSPLHAKHKIRSSVTKKTGKISKKIGKISKTGFSNMSFEDFPSDEPDEPNSSSVPFEVLRDERTPVDSVERKLGSLKGRTNPFS